MGLDGPTAVWWCNYHRQLHTRWQRARDSAAKQGGDLSKQGVPTWNNSVNHRQDSLLALLPYGDLIGRKGEGREANFEFRLIAKENPWRCFKMKRLKHSNWNVVFIAAFLLVIPILVVAQGHMTQEVSRVFTVAGKWVSKL